MAMNNQFSLRIKVFISLAVLTAISFILMVFLGVQMTSTKEELTQAVRLVNGIEKHAKEIGVFRGKIVAQRKVHGDTSVELNQTEIAKACSRNQAFVDKTAPVPDIDREDYIEIGHRVSLKPISKVDLARLFADLESSIPGSKIKSFNMQVDRNNANFWNVSFIIVKSVPKSID